MEEKGIQIQIGLQFCIIEFPHLGWVWAVDYLLQSFWLYKCQSTVGGEKTPIL
jgi:hypothetical protein